MALLEIESDQEQAQGRHFPDIHPLGECANHDGQLTPPGISSDSLRNLPNISPAGQREFLRKRRLLAKMEQEFQANGLPGQEAAKEFILHLYRRNCQSSTLRAYFGIITMFLSFLHHTGRAYVEALTREDLEAFL